MTRSSSPFLGWQVVGAAFAVLFLTYALQFSYGLFATGMVDDLGWSRADTALPYSIYVFFYSALSAVTGRATDRFGPRRVISVGALLLGVGWGLSALATAPWHLCVSLGVIAAFGTSVSWVPCNATVARWFSRRRGTAVALASSGASLGNFVGPVIAGVAIQSLGWRWSLALFAGISAGLMLVAARYMIRDPETVGQWPDGDATPPSAAALAGGYRPREALRLTDFHLLTLIYFLTWFVLFVPFVHGPALARDLNLPAYAGASLLSAIGIGGTVGRLGAGSASDRLGRCPTLFAICGLQALSLVQFSLAQSVEALWAAAVVFGVSYGGGVALLPALCGDLFGRAHVAGVVGVLFAIAGSPSAVGPWLAGVLFDASGSYRSTFLGAAVLNAIACALTGVLAVRLRARRAGVA